MAPMSTRVTAGTRLRASSRRAAATIASVGALMAAIFAMHTVSADGGHTAPESTMVTVVVGGASDAMAPVVHGDGLEGGQCAAGCGTPNGMGAHAMLMFGCVLALALVVAVAIRAVPSTRSWQTPPHHQGASGRDRRLRALPRPPSLLVLSISRT